ncbi:MAG: RHS repeat-associated core domain-containing protein [Alteromonadaceae bacterium TMED7]|nr:MAG: RHS repeat-associated core domain-containing protein [Alteromonadaceae bacterium TMED7]
MINFIQGRHMIDFRFLVKKSLAILKFMLLPVLLHTAAVKAEVTYIHTDYLGSVSAKSNASGQVIERFHYAPFGLPADSSELNNEQSYTGHVFDNESQLIYMQARYYDPVIGRFYSNDPVDFMGHAYRGNPVHGYNRYAYAYNNPYKYTDPNGQIPLLLAAPLIPEAVATASAITIAVVGYIVESADNTQESMDALNDLSDGSTDDDKNKNNQFAKRNKKEKNKDNKNKGKTQRGRKNVRGNDPNRSKAEEKTDNDRRNRATKDDNLKPKQEPKREDDA